MTLFRMRITDKACNIISAAEGSKDAFAASSVGLLTNNPVEPGRSLVGLLMSQPNCELLNACELPMGDVIFNGQSSTAGMCVVASLVEVTAT